VPDFSDTFENHEKPTEPTIFELQNIEQWTMSFDHP
jgi:hypothetical protein